MEVWLWAGIGVLVLIIIVLVIKICLLRKTVKEIEEGFADRLVTDTNTLISISSHDKYMRKLASAINVQLRKLRAQRRRFRQGDLELKNAVTNISHDLRTPLTAVCGYLDLLEQEEKSETVERYIGIIRNRTELLRQLTEELFRYSVILAADKELSKEPVVVNRILEESIAAFYTLTNDDIFAPPAGAVPAEGRNIIPDIRIPEEKVIRNLDASALSRVFANLLHNAGKYSDGDLEIELLETGEIRFGNHASALNGVDAGRLFDRFYTVEAARNSSGLGLSIARTLVEQMGGRIWAEYEKGRLDIRIFFPEEEV